MVMFVLMFILMPAVTFMLMPMPAVTFMLVLMPAVTFVLMPILMPAPAFMPMVPMSAAASMLLCLPAMDLHPVLYGPGQFRQRRDQGIGILRRQMQLPGGKSDGSIRYAGMGLEFAFDLGRAVGAVQILYNIDLPPKKASSLNLYMSIYSYV